MRDNGLKVTVWTYLALFLGMAGLMSCRGQGLIIDPYRFAPSATADLTNLLVAYWTLDEASGTRVNSADTGTAADLSSVNSVSSTPGKINNALLAEVPGGAGTAKYVRRTAVDCNTLGTNFMHGSSSPGADTSFTIAGWVSFENITDARYWVNKHGATSGDTIGSHYNPGTATIRAWIRKEGGGYNNVDSTNVVILANTWYYVVIWYDKAGATFNIQVDNGDVGVVSLGGGFTLYDCNTTFTLGNYNDGHANSLKGRVDEVGMWKRVLTSAERTALYNSGNGLTYADW